MSTRIIIYYFSGTGNSKRVSEWIKMYAGTKGHEVEIHNIAEGSRRNLPVPPQDAIIGFCSPTHGFNFPPVMMHFLLNFPRAKNKIFIINTRAGMKISKLFLPGLSGMCQYFYALLFLLKGYKIIGMRPIDLPSNWISLHPGLKTSVVDSLHQHWQQKTKLFAEKILSGKRDLAGLYDLIQDIVISPVAFGYYVIGRFMIAKSFYADSSCNNCDLCIKECPIQAIKKVSHRPFWTYHCESCMHCMNNCPKRAIQTAHGFFIGAIFLSNSVVLVLFWKFISQYIELPVETNWFQIIDFIVSILITFFTFMVSYRIFHYLIRIPVFREIISYTSFTRFKFWRRYKYKKKQIN